MDFIRVVCAGFEPGISFSEGSGVHVGFQFVRASSMAWEVFSSSVRRTMALLVSPLEMAASRACLWDRRCERRWIMGQRSVEKPRSVSTAFRGEERLGISSMGGMGNGVDDGWWLVFGEVPSERAAITS